MSLANGDNGFQVYRVRKSARYIKSQTGAFLSLICAVKRAQETKCNVYDSNLNCIYKYNITEVKFMNSPYNGKFKVSQLFKGEAHDGLDLVGIDSKEIHSTINGVVEKAGWENALNKKQGFGLYVRIKRNGTNDKYYFGHLSQINVKKGEEVVIGQIIGIEGNTGNSTGSHCHYCARGNGSKTQIRDICEISGIPNRLEVFDDGYLARLQAQAETVENLADEVLAGKWGNGEERRQRLTEAGYDYAAVQQRVNEKVQGSIVSVSSEQIAKEVIAGKWGNGEERRQRLAEAGYNPTVIQQLVNEMLRG